MGDTTERNETNMVFNLTLDKGESRVSISKHRPRRVPFLMVGSGGTNSEGRSMNLVQEMSEMTKQELYTFALVEAVRDNDTNLASVSPDKLETPAERQRFKIGMMGLRKRDLVKKVSRGLYIVNPILILPIENLSAMKLYTEL